MPTDEIWITYPPYREWQFASSIDTLPGELRLGTVLGVGGGLARNPIQFDQHGHIVARLVSTLPWVPIVLRVKDSRIANIHLVRAAGALGFSGIVADDESLCDALREDLCTEPRGRALATFLRACFPGADAAVRDEALGLLVSGLDRGEELRLPAAVAAGRSKRLRRDRLPSPERLRRSGQLISVVLDVQRNSSLHLSRLAELHGYASGSSLDRALRRRFRAGVTAMRQTLGWQPWLARALCPDQMLRGTRGYRANLGSSPVSTRSA